MERYTEKKQSSSPRKASSVKFDFSQNVEYESEPIYDDEAREMWYVKADYKEFKSSFIALAKQFQCYDRKISDPQSFKAVLVKAFKACGDATEDPRSCRLERADEKALRSWLGKGSRRGIERISVLAIFADKSARRKKISTAVLEAQENAKNLDYEAKAEQIREASVKISRCSRLFAWRLAL